MPDDPIYAPFSIARREDGTLDELGRGAMGITYKATDTQLGRTVALKVINATYLGDPIARQRFLAEARAAAQLQHANVASVYHLRAEGDDVFYAMEFVKGETVEAYVKRRGPLPARLALRIILQAAQGLAAANERGLIHRDIKPANLMLARAPAPAGGGIEHEEEDGLLVKVIDFGLAKSVSGNESGGGLTGGSVVGTPHFMSPEQISLEAGRVLDCRSDIYSLGVTLWYLLVGRPPFEGPQFQILSQHLQKRPPLEELSEAGVAMEIVALVGSMLAKDREERPANYPALIAALKKLLRMGGSTTTAGGEATADVTEVMPARPKQAPQSRAARRVPAWVIAAAIAAVVTFGGLFLRRSPVATPGAASGPLSEAAQLANRAREMLDKIGYTREDLGVAEDLSRRATELEPTSSSAWSARAAIQSAYILRQWDLTEKRRQDTEAFAKHALSLNPDEPDALYALGRVLLSQGAPKPAEECLRRAVALRPEDNRLRRSLANALAAQGRSAEARAELEEALRRKPGDALAHYELAIEFFHSDTPDIDSALKGLDAALAIQPLTSARLQKARLLGGKGDLAGMRAELEKIPPADRGEERAIYIAMWAALMERKPELVLEASALTAKSYFDDLTLAGPKAWLPALAYTVAGKENLARLQWQNAEAVLRQRLRDQPDNLADKARLAVTLAWLGRKDEAAREMAPVESTAAEMADRVLVRLIAYYYAAQRDAVKAVPWIRRTLQARYWNTPSLLPIDPFWQKLHGQPEFEALVEEFKPRSGNTIPGAADKKSVAVLAFENLSDDKSNEYFSDGVSEELLTVLQKIPGLRVAARTSAFSFKGKNVTAQEIGRQLGVAQIVEGSVRKSGNSVRIAARLSRAETGEQVWSENYTRDLKDVFAVQTEIAQTIVEQLRGQLDAGPGGAAAKAQIQSQVQAAEKGGTKNVEAYQHYLRGRFLSNQFSSEGLAKALVSYRKAVELDPGFALAWAALSETLSLQTGWDSGDQPLEEGFKRAREAVDRALAVEPNLAEALLALGRLQIWHDFDWRGGKASARRALELAPSSAQGLGFLAECEAAVGNVERALELGRQAITLDPLNPEIRLNHGIFLAQRGPYAEAASEFRRTLEITPNAIGARANWSTAALLEGLVDEAVAIAEKDSPGWGRYYALSIAHWQQGRRAEADAELRGLEESFAHTAAYQVGEVYAYRGELDKAFAWLDRAFQQRDPGFVYLKLDRLLVSLHADPRWAALLQRAGLAGDPSK